MNRTEEKEEKIRNAFINTIFDESFDIDKFENFIKVYSYYVSQVNSDYKYNQTYLPVYLDRFRHFKVALTKKREIMKEVEKLCDILNDIEFGRNTELKVFVDKFWEISEIENEPSENFTGILEENLITSKDVFLEIEVRNENNERARWARKIYVGEDGYQENIEKFFNEVVHIMRGKEDGYL